VDGLVAHFGTMYNTEQINLVGGHQRYFREKYPKTSHFSETWDFGVKKR